MVQILQPREDWANFGRDIGSGLTEGYMDRTDEDTLKKAVEALPKDASPRDILNAVTSAKTYSPKAKQKLFENYLGVAEMEQLKAKEQARKDEAEKKEEKKREADETKKKEERTKVEGLVKMLPLDEVPEQQREEERKILGETLDLKQAQKLIEKSLSPKKENLTEFEKGIIHANVKEYENLAHEIPKLESDLRELKDIQKISDELGETFSTKGGWNLIKSALGVNQKAMYMENTAFPMVENILKIFNKSGVVSNNKLQLIKDKYGVSSTDNSFRRNAKIQAMKNFAQQALARGRERMNLIMRTKGNPTLLEKELQTFDQESATMADVMLDYDLDGEEVKVPELNPAEWKGRYLEDPSGRTIYSDGVRWTVDNGAKR